MKSLIIINKFENTPQNPERTMSFGQNFGYSKTKEHDVALMIAADVRSPINTLDPHRYPKLHRLDGSIHLQTQP